MIGDRQIGRVVPVPSISARPYRRGLVALMEKLKRIRFFRPKRDKEMNPQSGGQASSRRIGRSILAVVTGIVVGIVLSTATDFGLHAIRLAPSVKERWPNHLLALATIYRSIYGIFASYVIARLAPYRPMAHSLTAGALGMLLSSLGAIAAWSTTVGQHWYPVALSLTALPTAWIGAKLWLMQLQSQTATA